MAHGTYNNPRTGSKASALRMQTVVDDSTDGNLFKTKEERQAARKNRKSERQMKKVAKKMGKIAVDTATPQAKGKAAGKSGKAAMEFIMPPPPKISKSLRTVYTSGERVINDFIDPTPKKTHHFTSFKPAKLAQPNYKPAKKVKKK